MWCRFAPDPPLTALGFRNRHTTIALAKIVRLPAHNPVNETGGLLHAGQKMRKGFGL